MRGGQPREFVEELWAGLGVLVERLDLLLDRRQVLRRVDGAAQLRF